MRKFSLFVLLFVYVYGASGLLSLAITPKLGLTDLRNPGDLTLAIFQTFILYFLSRWRWNWERLPEIRQYRYPGFFNWVIGILLLLLLDPLVSLYFNAEGFFSLIGSTSLYWYYARLYAVILLPVSFLPQLTHWFWAGESRRIREGVGRVRILP